MSKTVLDYVKEAAIYVTGEASIRIDCYFAEEEYFLGTDEDTGESYQVQFDDVDLEKDTFFKLVRMN